MFISLPLFAIDVKPIINPVQDGDTVIKVNDGGTIKDMITFDGATADTEFEQNNVLFNGSAPVLEAKTNNAKMYFKMTDNSSSETRFILEEDGVNFDPDRAMPTDIWDSQIQPFDSGFIGTMGGYGLDIVRGAYRVAGGSTWDAQFPSGASDDTASKISLNGSGIIFFVEDGYTGGSEPNTAMIINSLGNVGIGTASADERLHVERGDASAVKIKLENTEGYWEISFDNDQTILANNSRHFLIADDSQTRLPNLTTGAEEAYVCWDSSIGVVTRNATCTTSTRSSKKDIVPLEEEIDPAVLYDLEPVVYTYKNGLPDSSKRQLGFIAEDVNEILPQVVDYEDDGKTPQALLYDRFTALIVAEMKNLKAENEDLKRRITALEGDR